MSAWKPTIETRFSVTFESQMFTLKRTENAASLPTDPLLFVWCGKKREEGEKADAGKEQR